MLRIEPEADQLLGEDRGGKKQEERAEKRGAAGGWTIHSLSSISS
jgi:hypothetical protein